MCFRIGNSERGIRDSTETRCAHTELNRFLRANCQTFPGIKQRRVDRRLGARYRHALASIDALKSPQYFLWFIGTRSHPRCLCRQKRV
jgi:hypothetical protein